MSHDLLLFDKFKFSTTHTSGLEPKEKPLKYVNTHSSQHFIYIIFSPPNAQVFTWKME